MTANPHDMPPLAQIPDFFEITWSTLPVAEPAFIALQGGLAGAAFLMLTPIAARSAMALTYRQTTPADAKKRAGLKGPA